MADIVTKIGHAMSLRKPQKEALSYLDAISTHCDYKKDSKSSIEATASQYCEKQRSIKVDDKFSFPSFCYAMATGIGKTRLMGACIYYLYKTKGYRHFFILAPGNTIYEKLRKESNPNHPKYIFKGLESEMGRPKVYDGENYDSYPVRYEQLSLRLEKSSEIELFIFNIGKIFNNKTDTQFNFHKFKETLGTSFAEVLASFDDLVICMDEAHRYYAPASMKAINFLKPVLGLEFTATPKSTNNVIYAYDLARGAVEGYLKTPVVMGRSNMAGYSAEDIEEMKIRDGLTLHEHRKGVIRQFCNDHNLPYVKPIVLIACRDTNHAKEIRSLIDSDSFLNGKYKGKVIEIHSNMKGDESEENIRLLLSIEHTENPIEIVLHVYKLKEGWDVNNLFTIIPLNAAKSDILAMQTIGRGLRLPFGQATGNEDIDTLDIVAHDHYRELVDEIKGSDIFKYRDLDKSVVESSDTVDINSPVEENQLNLFDFAVTDAGVKSFAEVHENPQTQQDVYAAYLKAFGPTKKAEVISTTAEQLSLEQIIDAKTDTAESNNAETTPLPEKGKKPLSRDEFVQKIKEYSGKAISVPKILVQTTSEITFNRFAVKRTIQDFEVAMAKIERFDAINQQLLTSVDAQILEVDDALNTLACMLLDSVSEFSYEDADYVIDIVQQYLAQIEGDEETQRKIVRRYASLIISDIKKQIFEHTDCKTEDVYIVQKELILFRKFVKNVKKDGRLHFDKPFTDKINIKKYLFTGYKKAYYTENAFDSETDLMGPQSVDEVLDESPRSAYIIGMLASQNSDTNSSPANEQEVDSDIAYGDSEDYTADADDENEPVVSTSFKLPTSIGISFYIESFNKTIYLDVSWGDYIRSAETRVGKDGKEYSHAIYTRQAMKSTLQVDLSSFKKSSEFPLVADSNIIVYVSKIPLKSGYSLVTAYIMNRRKNSENDVESMMFQVELKAYSPDGSNVFFAENICRDVLAKDEFYFAQRPILGRGRNCAATWGDTVDGRTSWVKSDFIPEYEFPGVSAALKGFDAFYFSMRFMSVSQNKADILDKLNTLANSYEKWIQEKLIADKKMANAKFKAEIGDEVVTHCWEALHRIREGITLITNDEIAFDAFCFMNRAMLLQRNIMSYSKKHGAGIECHFRDFVDPKKPNTDFGWRPFQIAFILMNLSGIVDPTHKDREIVDLLYFPTGGGKTEAYLGLMAFVIANRRLRATEHSEYNADGGVTAILRYTLRLLTTQQRDRITKMVIAAELIRRKTFPKYGTAPISIGFWVGGGVTPNKFEELVEKADLPGEAKRKRNLLYKQLLTCPFCGSPLTEREFSIDPNRKSVTIHCADRTCLFYKYKQNPVPLPIYLVDEEIYAKCPTIILSTVDKFARLPWDVKTNALFGRVDRFCSWDGYVAIGEEHKRHNKTNTLPTSILTTIRPFLPPELIIQDELHLITGPLGTIYGAYESIIEDMCTYGERKIKPKYVVSTATIKNASAQTRCLYARKTTAQFPPNGFEIGDSFFINEISTNDDPFRKYVGVCAPGQSVKTALLRMYAIILQTSYQLAQQPEYKDVIDPYYSLVGYYNSIRELGGAVRLLQDDIPKRIYRIKTKYNMARTRYLNKKVEITSRMPSYEIPNKLRQLEETYDSKDCLDTAVATNMIAVGMDVDRLGLMVVTGQPKQNSEYIQATSRIGRAYPGLVFTLYNPYRPRDLSHYENFTGYHAQLYRFVEGTTATPFSARARDRVLHALIISAIRLKYPEMASNEGAADVAGLSDTQLTEIKALILNRLNIVKPEVRQDAEREIDQFIGWWKVLAAQSKPLRYYVYGTEKYNRLMNYYGQPCKDTEKATLNSMREVENAANMFYYTEE